MRISPTTCRMLSADCLTRKNAKKQNFEETNSNEVAFKKFNPKRFLKRQLIYGIILAPTGVCCIGLSTALATIHEIMDSQEEDNK